MEWAERKVDQRREQIRQLECAAAAADLADPATCAIASRLLREWTGSAADLIVTARAVRTVDERLGVYTPRRPVTLMGAPGGQRPSALAQVGTSTT